MAPTATEPATPTIGRLIYDGDCGFCTATASWFGRRRKASEVAVQPWQALDLDRFGLTERQTRTEVWWVDAEGHNHGGHRAVSRALEAMGGAWSLAGRLLRLPPASWAAALAYRLVARNRHRLPGSTDACRLDP
ncbi:DUF393 domain-containing protein [Iamia sp.]|uniref:thiol-disulfide oxidoreductase DCC family protein n=1 Tax=Iamia sp. TaxID=2722710 RepID=UPI002B8FB496|nr:DUF393 domain-containing protein [Iamia sp.]HXH56376.1 DUF393 domain-containing protein [Iamia sp.]